SDLGSVLDAGTGRSSMRWLLAQDTKSWAAVTGSSRMAEITRTELGDRLREQDQVIVGNWMDPDLLAGQVFDTVLADYLLGAMEAFAPYWQDRLFQRLRPHVGKRLYIIGLEPYLQFPSDDRAGRMIVTIGRLRDACLLLAGDQPYREYPMEWVLRNLEQAGYRILDAHRIAIRYGERFINSQLDLSARALGRVRDRTLAGALQSRIAETRALALALNNIEGGLLDGHDCVIAAEPVGW